MGAGIDCVRSMRAWIDCVPSMRARIDCVPSIGAGIDCVPSMRAGIDCVPSMGAGIDCVPSMGDRIDCVPSMGARIDCVPSMGARIYCVPSMGTGIDYVPSIDSLCTINGGCICGDSSVIKFVQPNIVADAVTTIIFRFKKLKNCFLIFAQNIDCEAVLTSTRNLYFLAKIRIMYAPCKPKFNYIKVGCTGVFITRVCYIDVISRV